MPKKPSKPTPRPPKAGVAKSAKEPPVRKLTDVFTTLSGETMTRRQLSNLVSRANYRAQQSIKYLTPGEYENVRENYAKTVMSTGLFEKGSERFTLKGITDPKELRKIEAAARKALKSRYLTPAKYKKIENARKAAWAEEGITGKDYEMLQEIFKSQEWHRLQKTGYNDSNQVIAYIKDDLLSKHKLNNRNLGVFKDILDQYDSQLQGGEVKPITIPTKALPKPRKGRKKKEPGVIYNKNTEDIAEQPQSELAPPKTFERSYVLNTPQDVIDAFIDAMEK